MWSHVQMCKFFRIVLLALYFFCSYVGFSATRVPEISLHKVERVGPYGAVIFALAKEQRDQSNSSFNNHRGHRQLLESFDHVFVNFISGDFVEKVLDLFNTGIYNFSEVYNIIDSYKVVHAEEMAQKKKAGDSDAQRLILGSLDGNDEYKNISVERLNKEKQALTQFTQSNIEKIRKEEIHKKVDWRRQFSSYDFDYRPATEIELALGYKGLASQGGRVPIPFDDSISRHGIYQLSVLTNSSDLLPLTRSEQQFASQTVGMIVVDAHLDQEGRYYIRELKNNISKKVLAGEVYIRPDTTEASLLRLAKLIVKDFSSLEEKEKIFLRGVLGNVPRFSQDAIEAHGADGAFLMARFMSFALAYKKKYDLDVLFVDHLAQIYLRQRPLDFKLFVMSRARNEAEFNIVKNISAKDGPKLKKRLVSFIEFSTTNDYKSFWQEVAIILPLRRELGRAALLSSSFAEFKAAREKFIINYAQDIKYVLSAKKKQHNISYKQFLEYNPLVAINKGKSCEVSARKFSAP